MRCPALSELPSPADGLKGWPWTEESLRISGDKPNIGSWPKMTIVTPSYNQGPFIEATIRSVLLQGYPDLEYFVLDGGSTDNTVEVLEKYSQWITFWVSEPDEGQSSAINRGIGMGHGAYATWINSDDLLCKDALGNHFKSVGPQAKNVFYVGDCIHINSDLSHSFRHRGQVESLEDLLRVDAVWRRGGSIDQPAVIFPRRLFTAVGGVAENNHRTMDYELWGKFFLAGAQVEYTRVLTGIFRHHDQQKTASALSQTSALIETAKGLLGRADNLSTPVKSEILLALESYRQRYPAQLWRESGRLARMGLPHGFVDRVRSTRNVAQKMLKRVVGL